MIDSLSKLVRSCATLSISMLVLCAAAGCNGDAVFADAGAGGAGAGVNAAPDSGMKPRAAPRVGAFDRARTAVAGAGGLAGTAADDTAGSNGASMSVGAAGADTSMGTAGASAVDAGPAEPPDASAAEQPADDVPDASIAGADVDSFPRTNESPAVLWVGRVDTSEPDVARFAWQGAGLIANVEGREIAVRLRTESDSSVFYRALIDGDEVPRFGVDDEREVMLATDLDPGPHRVELYRETESLYGVSAFLGFTRGQVRGAPERSQRMIEVVGDSISVGYGALGYELHPNGRPEPACTGDEENSTWYDSYSALAGRELQAEVSTIAHTGWGMSRDAEGSPSGVLPSLWDRVFGDSNSRAWSFESKASAVVINLGTNDWKQGDPGDGFARAYARFVERVRSEYPDAWIFFTLGTMLGEPDAGRCLERMQSVMDDRAAMGDSKLRLVDLGIQSYGDDGLTPTGCNWHPNLQEHQRMADILERELAATLGW